MSTMKYILVTGGVISGIGKGVIASSLGTILKHCGLRVTSIKIDPYINIDAGTFSPYEHGEVYVLDDGGEVDLDLGNYERFLDVTLHRDNNITTGKVYSLVIEKERKGDYTGKSVKIVPHMTDAIQEWVERVAHKPVDGSDLPPEVCIIELGGTIGDIEGMPFVEAFRQFQFKVQRENFVCVYVSLVPRPNSTGEHKTKPTQAGIRELRGLGLSPDFIACRSEKPIGEAVRNKISNFCRVDPTQVLCLHDASNIYAVPLLMEKQKVSTLLNKRLNLGLPEVKPRGFMRKWKDLVSKQENLNQDVKIALVGKYTQLNDAYASVIDALNHAALTCNRKLTLMRVEAEDLEDSAQTERPLEFHQAWQNVCSSNGVLVPGGFGSRGLEGKILACSWARKRNIPFLGVCLGMQAAVIEFSRNVLGLKGANSQEIEREKSAVDDKEGDVEKHNVVMEMLEFNPGMKGGTMRLGIKKTIFKNQNYSKIRRLYGNPDSVNERHRHRYEVNPKYIEALEEAGMKFVGEDEEHQRMEILELDDHPYYVACQYHPEYLTRPLKPSPPYLGLILAAIGKLQTHFNKDCDSGSPYDSPTSSDEEVPIPMASLNIAHNRVNKTNSFQGNSRKFYSPLATSKSKNQASLNAKEECGLKVSPLSVSSSVSSTTSVSSECSETDTNR